LKGIIIAAGPATRLRPLTEHLPKCMLKINGKPVIQSTIETLRNNGIEDISVIRGYQKDKINFKDVNYFENKDFWSNNILHSLSGAGKLLVMEIKPEGSNPLEELALINRYAGIRGLQRVHTENTQWF